VVLAQARTLLSSILLLADIQERRSVLRRLCVFESDGAVWLSRLANVLHSRPRAPGLAALLLLMATQADVGAVDEDLQEVLPRPFTQEAGVLGFKIETGRALMAQHEAMDGLVEAVAGERRLARCRPAVTKHPEAESRGVQPV
jgi:hypothetical protein